MIHAPRAQLKISSSSCNEATRGQRSHVDPRMSNTAIKMDQSKKSQRKVRRSRSLARTEKFRRNLSDAAIARLQVGTTTCRDRETRTVPEKNSKTENVFNAY